jgi:hypothetical protein
MSAFDPLKSSTATSRVKQAPAGGAPAAKADAAKSAASVYAADQATLTVPATEPIDFTGLNEEEVRLVKEGFLPNNFAELRQIQRTQGKEAAKAFYRQGIKGPFEGRFGDPDVMLDGAKRFAANPELGKLAKAIKPGDIVVTTYNKKDDVISQATKGPFVHALVCTKAGPPQEFVEAVGMTGDINDPNSNKVLRSMMSTHGHGDMTFRVMRPTEGLAPHEADKAIKRAISYVENQLGKPYDFAFTDTNGQGMNDAFYCSELAYKAYADPKGADLPFKLSKSPERDVVLNSLADILEGLNPDDQGALTFEAVKMGVAKPLDEKKLVDFIVNKVAAGTEATRDIANTPARRAALKATIEKVIAGKAFDGTQSALESFSKQESKGAFNGFTGFFKRVGAGIKVGIEGLKDVRELTQGIGFFRSIGVAWKLANTVVPHAETLTNHFFGPDDPRTKGARDTLNTLDGMARDAHRVPLLGKLWPLPSRPRKELNTDFVSPTDLGWADAPHWDFNVKQATPVDQKVVEQKARAEGK